MCGLPSCTLNALCIGIDSKSMYRLPPCANMVVKLSLPPFKNERQQIVNVFRSCMVDNRRAIDGCYPNTYISAAFMGKNASDNIASASYSSVPRQRQQFSEGHSTLDSNELLCMVPDLSRKRSVFSICHCIQLHKYSCNVSQIWLFFACSSSHDIRTHIILYYEVTIWGLSSRIMEPTNSYCDVRFKIIKYLIPGGYDLFQKWRCLHAGLERP